MFIRKLLVISLLIFNGIMLLNDGVEKFTFHHNVRSRTSEF